MTMNIRKARDEDADQIVRIFHETIHTVNLGDYTQEQVDAWSPEMPTPQDWITRHLRTRLTFVADDNGVLAGFAELEPNGNVDCFYCHHQYQRKGVGSAILCRIEQQAVASGMSQLFTEASITARRFFEAHGFTVVKQQTVTRRDVALTNFVMEKYSLAGSDHGKS
jgi:putative acetyltransferase